jgi:hypothetical protein
MPGIGRFGPCTPLVAQQMMSPQQIIKLVATEFNLEISRKTTQQVMQFAGAQAG